MDVKNKLMHERENLLKEISESAQRGNTHEVLITSEKLSKVKSLLDRYDKLRGDIDDLFTPNGKPQPSEHIRGVSDPFKNTGANRLDTAGRGIGRTIRLSFLKKASEDGIHLSHVRGSIYETQTGHRVGIAVATERRPDRWFLGLPSKRFEHAVLLCKPDIGEIIEICIPKNVLDEYRMSESGGQTKFNISHRGSDYLMLVPGTEGVSISKFVGDCSLLQ